MKKCILVLCLLFGAASILAQPRDSHWARNYGGANGETFCDVQHTSDGNYILCGATNSYGSPPYGNGWVVKINPAGDTLWTRAYNAGLSENFYKVRELSDGSFILGGITDAWPTNWSRAWLMKISANGDSLWSRFYSNGSSIHNYLESIEPLSTGGFVFVGVTGAEIWEHCDLWIVRTDNAGNDNVNKKFNHNDCDIAFCVREITDGFMVAGLTRASLHADQGWLLKLNFAGDSVWTRTYGGPSGDEFFDLVCTADGGYAMTGQRDVLRDYTGQAWLLKVDSNGEIQWSHSYGAPWCTYSEALLQTSDGGFAFGGWRSDSGSRVNDMYLVRTDLEGNQLWSRIYGGPKGESCNGFLQTSEDGFLLAGHTYSFGLRGDGWIVNTVHESTTAGWVTLEHTGPPDWNYRMYWLEGSISELSFSNLCPGTIGSVEGEALLAGWTVASYPNHVVFSSIHPLTTGSLSGFVLSHPDCYALINWTAGDNSGLIDGPLPVELLSFTATVSTDAITLHWSTASETDNDYFEIMRGESPDGEFTLLTELESQGESSTEQHYLFPDHDVVAGCTYWYYLADVDINGNRTEHREQMTSAQAEKPRTVPADYAITSYPNPFNPKTTIKFALPEAGLVVIRVFDATGRLVQDLVNSSYDEGEHEIVFNAESLPTGIYFARLECGSVIRAYKLMLIR
jgi:hypothetical protein